MQINKKRLAIFLIVLNIFLSSYWVLHSNIYFHSDIARDFLLIEEIVNTQKPALIGARSGGIEGVFHGPLWLYINLPAYLIGNGSPVIVGWFWVLLSVIGIYSIYRVAHKLFGRNEALTAAFLMSVYLITPVHHFLNSDGVLLISPLYFYFFYKYTQKQSVYLLALSLILAGILAQFQLAFGMPIILLTIFYAIIITYRSKKSKHLLAFFVLLIPLSTFIMFDLRHDFLQTKAILDSLSAGSFSKWKFVGIIVNRLEFSVYKLPLALTRSPTALSVLLVSLLLLVKKYNFNSRHSSVINVFLYLYFGYWFLTIFFPGNIASWYYIGFFPIVFILMGSIIQKSVLFLIIIIALTYPRYLSVYKDLSLYNNSPANQPTYTWQFNKIAAETVLYDAPGKFGYFVLTPDLYGYPPTYAMHYTQKSYPDKNMSNSKEEITYLLIGATDNNPYANPDVWKERDLGITSNPIETINFKNGFRIEKYRLNKFEITTPTNPNLINSTFFR